MPQAMKIPDVKAAVDKECDSSMESGKVKSKKEVILEAEKKENNSPFCHANGHLKNAELEPKNQKHKGRVVLRGDIVKYDSGSYAVFTEQGVCLHHK